MMDFYQVFLLQLLEEYLVCFGLQTSGKNKEQQISFRELTHRQIWIIKK